MDEKEIIRKHFSELAKKSHSAVQKKYGPNYYRDIVKIRWDKQKKLKAEQNETVEFKLDSGLEG